MTERRPASRVADTREPADTFHIEFDTKSYPGKIAAIGVTLKRDIVSDPNVSFRVDLADHPLYPALVRHVSNYLRKRRAGQYS